MNYRQFLLAVTKEMQAAVPGGESVTIHTVLKNNGIRMKAMSVRCENEEVCPMIYMAPFYRMYLSGRPIAAIVKELQAICRMNGGDSFDSRIFFHFGSAQKRLAYRIIHYDSNRELLSRVPHRKLLDFAAVYYLSLEGKDGMRGSALVYNDYLRLWGTDEEELYRLAAANMPTLLPVYTESLDHLLEGMLLPADASSGTVGAGGIYVISNRYNCYGAAAVFYPGVLRELADTLGTDLYLLPSSVHEFLAISADCGIETEKLNRLVMSMNQLHLAPEDVLSSRIYRYSIREDRLLL